jgi:hypothetical protein
VNPRGRRQNSIIWQLGKHSPATALRVARLLQLQLQRAQVLQRCVLNDSQVTNEEVRRLLSIYVWRWLELLSPAPSDILQQRIGNQSQRVDQCQLTPSV